MFNFIAGIVREVATAFISYAFAVAINYVSTLLR